MAAAAPGARPPHTNGQFSYRTAAWHLEGHVINGGHGMHAAYDKTQIARLVEMAQSPEHATVLVAPTFPGLSPDQVREAVEGARLDPPHREDIHTG